jgi:hypothetical protein
MVPVDYEIRLAKLDGDDRRKPTVGKRFGQRARAVATEPVPRLELAREPRGSAVGPDQLFDGIARTPR